MSKKKSVRYEMDMCTGSILRKMILFAVPLMCSGVLQLLFNAADIIVVGRFAGDNSLAAVGSTASLIGLLTNLFIGLSVGGNVLTAHYYGAKKPDHLKETIHTAITLSIVSGLILTVVGVFGARGILTLMDTPPEVLEKAVLYLRIYFGGMTATMVYNFGSAILRAFGDTKRPLYFLSFAGVMNVILNLIFVILFHMDVAGVALATIISQCISACLVIRCLMHEREEIRLDLRQLRLTPDKFRRILRIGLPAGLQGTLFSLSNVVIQSSVNSFGAVIVAGNSAAQNIEGFGYTAMNAFHQASISFTSQNLGAKKFDRINKILVRALMGVACIGFGFALLMFWKGEWFLGLYSDSSAVLEAGLVRLRLITSFYFLAGMMDVVVGSLRGLGHSVFPMIVSLVGVCGLRLLWVSTIFQMEAFHTPFGIYMTYPISWALTFLVLLIGFYKIRKKLSRDWGV